MQKWGAGNPTWRSDLVAPELVHVSVPRPRGYVNVYLIGRGETSTLVDCAEDSDISRTALFDFLETRGAFEHGLSQIFLTHGHRDHSGLAEEIASRTGATVVAHPAALEPTSIDLDFLRRHGYEDTPRPDRSRPPALQVPPERLRLVGDADLLEAGPYRFRLLSTPGHHRGHLCGFDPESGLLLSGDRILRVPTGVGLYTADGGDPLSDHLASAAPLRSLRARAVLPGHGRVFADADAALGRDYQEHVTHISAVLDGIAPEGSDATTLARGAALPDWAHPGSSPISGIWALGRTLAALRLLERRGWIGADESSEPVRFHRLTERPFAPAPEELAAMRGPERAPS